MVSINHTYAAKHHGGTRPINSIIGLVFHYTGNSGSTATAQANARYFSNTTVSASAHYIVDETSIYQTVADNVTAWAVGDNNGKYINGGASLKGIIKNSNSISIEMVSHSNQNGYYIPEATKTLAIQLGKELLRKYPSIKYVCRHYDVSGKLCPEPMINDTVWNNFKNRLFVQEGILTMDQYNELKTIINAQSVTIESLSKELSVIKNKMIYNYVDNNMPTWARTTVQKLMNKGYLQGDNNGLGLTDDMLRILVILDRAGAFKF